MKVIIVGFKVKEENSTFYKKLDVVLGEVSDDARLLGSLKQALNKSDFISIRKVEDEPKPYPTPLSKYLGREDDERS